MNDTAEDLVTMNDTAICLCVMPQPSTFKHLTAPVTQMTQDGSHFPFTHA